MKIFDLDDVIEELNFKKDMFNEIIENNPNLNEIELNMILDEKFEIWRYTNK